MFRSVRQLQKQANEIQKDWDPGAQMAAGMDQMRAAQEMMAQQTQAANIAMSGVDATATITGVQQTGAMVNYQPTMQIDMTVLPDGLPPYPASVTQVVEQHFLVKAVPGASVPIKVDPNDPGSIWINWAAA
ncbi:MAG TPA: hypothetical protein VK506_11015 [Conexibacter sp.]|nr:hypothetical protein [Conexibacter sp.]